MTKLKATPNFATEKEEAEFWETHDSAEYQDWTKARPARFTNLKPSTKTISLRLPELLLADIKQLANKQDIPYQSLLKHLLAKAVEQERRQP